MLTHDEIDDLFIEATFSGGDPNTRYAAADKLRAELAALRSQLDTAVEDLRRRQGAHVLTVKQNVKLAKEVTRLRVALEETESLVLADPNRAESYAAEVERLRINLTEAANIIEGQGMPAVAGLFRAALAPAEGG